MVSSEDGLLVYGLMSYWQDTFIPGLLSYSAVNDSVSMTVFSQTLLFLSQHYLLAFYYDNHSPAVECRD